MNSEIKQRCELIVENRNVISHVFTWDETYTRVLGAFMLAVKNQRLDVERMNYCHALLKKNTSIFS